MGQVPSSPAGISRRAVVGAAGLGAAAILRGPSGTTTAA